MAKSDLLNWISNHCPPLLGRYNKGVKLQTEGESSLQNDWERGNACANATQVTAYLRSRCPPLTPQQVTDGYNEYLK